MSVTKFGVRRKIYDIVHFYKTLRDGEAGKAAGSLMVFRHMESALVHLYFFPHMPCGPEVQNECESLNESLSRFTTDSLGFSLEIKNGLIPFSPFSGH